MNVARARLRELNNDDGKGVRYVDVEDRECLTVNRSGGIAMIGAAGMIAQELATGQKLF